MKIKMIGFKVGKSRPVANKTIFVYESGELKDTKIDQEIRKEQEVGVGKKLLQVLEKSDFISIRRIEKQENENTRIHN